MTIRTGQCQWWLSGTTKLQHHQGLHQTRLHLATAPYSNYTLDHPLRTAPLRASLYHPRPVENLFFLNDLIVTGLDELYATQYGPQVRRAWRYVLKTYSYSNE